MALASDIGFFLFGYRRASLADIEPKGFGSSDFRKITLFKLVILPLQRQQNVILLHLDAVTPRSIKH
jgi:hypothetical protein